MKITLDVGPDAKVTAKTDAAGNVTGLEIVPVFSKKAGTAVVAFAEATTDKGGVIEQFSLEVSGRTGKLVKAPRASVVAAIDRDDPGDDEDEEDGKE